MQPTNSSNSDKKTPRSGNEAKTKIFQSRRRDTQKPMVNNDLITGIVPETFEGIFKVGKNGIGFVTHRESRFVVMIEPHHNTVHALHGDLVSIKIISKKDSTASVESIVRRAKSAYAGIIVQKADWYYFVPTDQKEPEMRVLPVPDTIAEAKNKKVLVSLGTWINDVPTCTLKTIIGEAGKNDTEIESIVMEKGFNREFPAVVEAEAAKLHGSGIPEAEIPKRRDMRGVTTFTIDPVMQKILMTHCHGNELTKILLKLEFTLPMYHFMCVLEQLWMKKQRYAQHLCI
jgi:exoribonuclease R